MSQTIGEMSAWLPPPGRAYLFPSKLKGGDLAAPFRLANNTIAHEGQTPNSEQASPITSSIFGMGGTK